MRFDFKQVDGKIINQGIEYRLVKDEWLIDQSPYLPEIKNRLPTPDELDYALLRVDGVPGKEAIGTKPDPSSRRHRGRVAGLYRYNPAPREPDLRFATHPAISKS